MMNQHDKRKTIRTRISAFDLIKPYFREHAGFIIFGLISLIIADSLQLFIPRFIKKAVDHLTRMSIEGKGLLFLAIEICVTAFLIAVFRYGWRRCLIGTSRRIEEGLRDLMFTHVQTLSARYFSKISTGDLMAHATNDITNIRMASGMGLVALIDAVFLGTSTVVFMLWINVRLTLFALIPMPFIVIGSRMFSRIMHRRYRDVQATFSDLTEGVRERLAGIRIIKAYTRETESLAHVESLSRQYVDKNIDLIRVTGSFFPLMMMLSNLSQMTVIYLGGRQTIFSDISTGDFVAFIGYLGLLTWPMMALGWMTSLIQRGRASLDRLGDIINEVPDITDPDISMTIPSLPSPLSFDSVDFSYAKSNKKVLDSISLTLMPGKVLGIVGPPGAGKTTLLNLIPRIFEPGAGSVMLGGIDMKYFKLSDIRKNISFIPQEPFLFDGSVRDNILIGIPGASDADIHDAAKRAFLMDDINRFPNGFDTIVGEKGVILSGGQKQRVTLARALLHDRSIMIFDDPVSQVDTRTGSEIIKTLRTFKGEKQVIISSHRLSAVMEADEIIVLTDGRITERGRHAQLMELGGYYARTFRLQAMEEGGR